MHTVSICVALRTHWHCFLLWVCIAAVAMAELCVSGCYVLSDSAVKNPEGEEGLGDAAQGDEHAGRENGQYLSLPVQSPDARSATLFVRKKTFSCTSN